MPEIDENEDAAAGPVASKRGGRKGNALKLQRKLAATLDPGSVIPHVYAALGDADGPAGALTAAEKMYRISSLVAARLENVAEKATTRSADGSADREALSSARQWVTNASPEDVLERAEAEFYTNERMLSLFSAQLVEHLVVREDLLSLVKSTRDRIGDQLHGIPRYMAVFAGRLMQIGVGVNDVHNMSEMRLGEVLRAIRGIPIHVQDGMYGNSTGVGASPSGTGNERAGASNSPISPRIDHAVPGNDVDRNDWVSIHGFGTGAGGVPDGAPRGPAAAKPVGEATDTTMGSEDGAATMGDVPVEPVVAPADGPAAVVSAPLGDAFTAGGDAASFSPFGDVLPDPVGAWRVPSAPWDAIDFRDTPWMVVERVASSDADTGALRYRLPTVATMAEMAQAGSTLERGYLERSTAGMDLGQGGDLVRRWSQRHKLALSKEEIQVWLLLLLVMSDPAKASAMVAVGNFHGVLLPGRTGGSEAGGAGHGAGTRVRQILARDPSRIAPGTAFRAVEPVLV